MRKTERVLRALKMTKKFSAVALKIIIHYNLCFKSETHWRRDMSDETLEKPKFSELTELGIKFYRERLKPLLEPEHNGEFVAIEPYSGKYFLNKNHTQAILNARAEMPDKLFFVARIGTIYTAKLRNYVPRKRLG